MSFITKLYSPFFLILILILIFFTYIHTYIYSNITVLPESPVVLDRWGRQLNSTKIGPMQEGEDIILSCRVVGGKKAL
jgi:hypothetical protein